MNDINLEQQKAKKENYIKLKIESNTAEIKIMDLLVKIAKARKAAEDADMEYRFNLMKYDTKVEEYSNLRTKFLTAESEYLKNDNSN